MVMSFDHKRDITWLRYIFTLYCKQQNFRTDQRASIGSICYGEMLVHLKTSKKLMTVKIASGGRIPIVAVTLGI